MARPLKQSTSVDVPIGPFVDATDGVTAETALTLTQPDIRLKKNGAAWAQKAAAQTLSHEENGFYEVTLDATDTDTLGLLRLAVFESGAAPVWEDFTVIPANVYDSMFSTDKLEVDVVQIGGSNVSTSSAQLGVNVVSAGGTAWGSGAITAASIAADAITAAKVADGTIDAATFAAGAITATVIATGAIDADAIADNAIDAGAIAADAITAAKIADGAIDAATFAAGAITATVIATGAIDADALAADAGTEIAAAVLAAAASNPIDANVQEVNDVALTGDGAATPWGPA